jgi:hypothetical protein
MTARLLSWLAIYSNLLETDVRANKRLLYASWAIALFSSA